MKNAVEQIKDILEHVEKNYSDFKPFTRNDCDGIMIAFRYSDKSFHYHIVTDENKNETDKDFVLNLMRDLIFIIKSDQWDKVRENFHNQFQLINEKDIEL